MKQRFRLYRRTPRGMFYSHDRETGKQESLGTKDKAEALTVLAAKNESYRQPALNFQIARTYLSASDPKIAKRTWQEAMDELVTLKKGENRERWDRAARDHALNSIRGLRILETRAEHLLKVLHEGKVATNVYLRRIHNFAIDMNWLPWPVIPKRQWPKIVYPKKRAITLQEHHTIIASECNPERIAFYELAWHLGPAQSDLADLRAQNIDWDNRLIRFRRKKTKNACILRFGDEVARILYSLPKDGLLFPRFHSLNANHRATEFKRACRRAGVSGVTLHSYRYAWAERAKTCGYPERFAQVALGHNSRAVHESYAAGAVPTLPALEDYEKASDSKVVPMGGNRIAS